MVAREDRVLKAIGSKLVQLAGLITHTDDVLEGTWQRHDWPTFIRTWLMASVGVAVVSFLMPFIMFLLPALIYDALALVMKTKSIPISFHDSLQFGWRFGAMVGIFFLVSTIPALFFKQICGDWKMVD